MPIAELDIAKVYYESSGSGPALVFAHGAGGNALSWWQQTAFFGARYRCITFDHPGFRHSSWLRPESDAEAVYGTVLHQLLDHLEIEKTALVAQSMGGWTCLRFAIDHPDRVAALVLAATDGGVFQHGSEAASEEQAQLEDIRSAWERGDADSYHPAAGDRMLKEQPQLHDMYVEIGEQNAGVSRRGWGEINAEELAEVRCSALLMTGEEDSVCTPRRVKLLHEAVSESELVTVPEAGHSIYFERAELFNRTVDRFLATVYPAASNGHSIIESFSKPILN